MADNWFDKKIILVNKKMICPSVNISSNDFLRKTVTINVISFLKSQKVVFHITGATLHSNCHGFIVKLSDVLLLVKHIIKDSFFYKPLG